MHLEEACSKKKVTPVDLNATTMELLNVRKASYVMILMAKRMALARAQSYPTMLYQPSLPS